jgi:hypothetical protein
MLFCFSLEFGCHYLHHIKPHVVHIILKLIEIDIRIFMTTARFFFHSAFVVLLPFPLLVYRIDILVKGTSILLIFMGMIMWEFHKYRYTFKENGNTLKGGIKKKGN